MPQLFHKAVDFYKQHSRIFRMLKKIVVTFIVLVLIFLCFIYIYELMSLVIEETINARLNDLIPSNIQNFIATVMVLNLILHFLLFQSIKFLISLYRKPKVKLVATKVGKRKGIFK